MEIGKFAVLVPIGCGAVDHGRLGTTAPGHQVEDAILFEALVVMDMGGAYQKSDRRMAGNRAQVGCERLLVGPPVRTCGFVSVADGEV
jgi:dihydroxyacetone kinase DhaKLM complex PTS-EIIA-like component DhaM